MHETDTPSTIDWNSFWTESTGDRRRSAHVGQYGKADVLSEFFESRGEPASLASVGCGPAACPVELAERYPGLAVYGYDAAEAAVAQAREAADRRGLENVTFDVAELPTLDVDHRFDAVYCYATLHYVADVASALQALFDCVADDGVLLFNYPNRHTRATYRRLVSGEADRPLPQDADAFRERYRLIFDGENLLSHDRIETILGRRPRSVWSVVDPPEAPWVGRDNPFVFVPK